MESRGKNSFFLLTPQGNRHAGGIVYQNLVRFQKKQSTEDRTQIAIDLHGTPANKGTAIGRVIICKTIAAIDKVKKGDILVASMTRPEFMPALKKAAAIITDEGGITCHAAIVARELNIPAVIGTKFATKVLKDGMLVEVRANHGIVKILKG